MVPKWFDKSPQRVERRQHRRPAACADRRGRDAYTSQSGAADGVRPLRRALPRADRPTARRAASIALTASYGAALIDRAILDALCRALRRVVRGRDPRQSCRHRRAPDARSRRLRSRRDSCASLAPRRRIAARHTVGLLDPLDAGDVVQRAGRRPAGDARRGHRALRQSLFQAQARAATPRRDVARLVRIAAVLDRLPEYAVTLDGNEQFDDVARSSRLLAPRSARRRALARLVAVDALPRAAAAARARRSTPTSSPLARDVPLLIDESDATLDAFPRARRCGYAGVSSKSCKGFYKSLLNAARCAQWNAAPAPTRCFCPART